MGTWLKIILMCGLGVLFLLGWVGLVTDFVQNGFRMQQIAILAIGVSCIVWWVRDFRSIIQKSKASKEE